MIQNNSREYQVHISFPNNAKDYLSLSLCLLEENCQYLEKKNLLYEEMIERIMSCLQARFVEDTCDNHSRLLIRSPLSFQQIAIPLRDNQIVSDGLLIPLDFSFYQLKHEVDGLTIANLSMAIRKEVII